MCETQIMNETSMVFVTTLTTVLSGVLVYVFSELIKDYILDPKKQFKELVHKIDFSLIMYAREISSPLSQTTSVNDEMYEIQLKDYSSVASALRELSADLASQSSKLVLSCKRNRKKRKTAAKELMGLSNNLILKDSSGDAINQNIKSVSTIRTCLGIEEER